MVRSIKVNGASLIDKASSGGDHLSDAINHSFHYGSAGQVFAPMGDTGYVFQKMMFTGHTLSALSNAATYSGVENSAFQMFRQEVARQASLPPQPISSGNTYTHFALTDMNAGQEAIRQDMADKFFTPERSLSKVDFSSPSSNAEYLEKIRKYASELDFSQYTPSTTSESEIMILMHTANTHEFTKYVNTFEDAIRDNFERELKNLQEEVVNLGYDGNINDISALETYSLSLNASDNATVQNLIAAQSGKTNATHRYILGRLHNNELGIDLKKVLAENKFCGVPLDEKSRAAFVALNVYANTDQILNASHCTTMMNLGYDGKPASINFNSLSEVRGRVTDMAGLLEKRGYLSFNGKELSALTPDELRAFGASVNDPDASAALSQMAGLKEHEATLNQKRLSMQEARAVMLTLFIKMSGNNDTARGLQEVRSMKHRITKASKIAMKAFQKAARLSKKLLNWLAKRKNKLISKMGKGILKAYRNARGIVKDLLKGVRDKLNTMRRAVVDKAKNAGKKVASKLLSKKAKEKLKTKAAKKLTSKILKVGTKALKWAQKAAELASKLKGAAFKFLIKLILYILLANIVLNLVGAILMCIGEAVTSIQDNALVKFIADLFGDFHWPWEASSAEKETIFSTTITRLVDLEQKTVYKQTPVSYTQPHWGSGEASKFKNKPQSTSNISTQWDAIGKTGSKNSTMMFYQTIRENGKTQKIPITEASVIRDVIAQTHAVTHPIDMKSDLQDFLVYADGLYQHITTSSLKVKMKFCESSLTETGKNAVCSGKATYFTYSCVNGKDTTFKNHVHSSKALFVGDKSYAETTITIKDDEKNHEDDKDYRYPIQDSDYFYQGQSKMYLRTQVRGNTTNGCCQFVVKTKTGKLDYNGSGESNIPAEYNGFDYLDNISGFDSSINPTRTIRIKDGNYTYTSSAFTVRPRIANACAQDGNYINQLMNAGKSGISSYIVYCSDGEMKNCSNSSAQKLTYNNGKTITKTVCLGHIKCNKYGEKHSFCPGHTVTYCMGHPEFQWVTHHNMDENHRRKDFSITYESKFFFFSTKTTIKAYSCFTDEFDPKSTEAWDARASLRGQVLANDWLESYNIQCGQLIGAPIRDYELASLVRPFNGEIITSHHKAAAKAAGNIPLYPEGRINTSASGSKFNYKYPLNGFNEPTDMVLDNLGYYRGSTGLDPVYFGEWVYLTCHGDEAAEAPRYLREKSYTAGCSVVNSKTPSGTIIKSTRTKATGVLLGLQHKSGTTNIVYLGYNSAGWVSLMRESYHNDWIFTQAGVP